MTDPRPGASRVIGSKVGGRVAEVMDSVRWEYDPEDELLSPLVSTERYFRDFPWDGGGEPADDAGAEQVSDHD